MSVGGAIGAFVGGVIGFVFGGPMGGLYGASIGFSIGMYLDPVTPDIPPPGAPLPAGAEIMLSTIGDPLPDLVGTAKITGHLLCYGKERTVSVMCETAVEGGKGGPPEPDPYVCGYEYYMSWAVGLLAGPIDTLYTIYKGEDVVWEGELDIPVSGGQETIALEGMGSAIFYFGTADQVVNSDVGDIIGDASLNSPYRHFCWCFFDDCNIGNYNRCPTMKFVLRKSPVIAFSPHNVLQTYDYNPMHAIWYVFHNLAGLPETWLHSGDFAAAASTLAGEFRGVCCFFNSQQNTLNYLESINSHIDGIIRYGSDGKFHPKLIRDDYVIGDLPLISEDVMLDDPTLDRKSWIDTANELKVQYTEIIRGFPFPQGEWVAALQQPNTVSIYVYDIGYKTVIKVATSIPTVVTDTLPLESLYPLDHSMGYGTPGAQRGGYCMNKDGSRLWYLFREVATGNCQLIEVDITQPTMSIVKKTSYSGLLAGEEIHDGCSDGTYTYWCTNKVSGRIIKIRNSDHSIITDWQDFVNLLGRTPPGCALYLQGTVSIDYSPATSCLYFVWVVDELSCSPAYYACSHYRIHNTNFGYVAEVRYCGVGLSVHKSQNLMRIVDDFVLQHRAYWPSSGMLTKRSIYTQDAFSGIRLQYLQNIFNVNDANQLFALWHTNATNAQVYIQIMNFETMASLGHTVVTSYCGWPEVDWDCTAVSAMNEMNEVIVLFRYNKVENKNYTACFRADLTLELLCDNNPLRKA